MKRRILLALALIVTMISYAQNNAKFEFEDRSYEMEETQVPDFVKSHYLGLEFRRGFYLLDEQYTYEIEPTATDPNPAPEIEKPAIYKGIKKLDKYYKKQLKKGLMSEDQARDELSRILAIGFSIRYQDTETFEQLLWEKRKPDEFIQVFLTQVDLY